MNSYFSFFVILYSMLLIKLVFATVLINAVNIFNSLLLFLLCIHGFVD